MSRRILDILLLTLPLSLLFNGCTPSPDYNNYSLSVQVRGLASNESITVSNGSNLEIVGTSDLSWTEAQRFKNGYRSDRPNYVISILRQPSNSNKICRVLNPVGKANYSTSVIRIECGYSVVISDTALGSMTSDNGLMVSNGYQTLALNSSRSLVTSLEHTIVLDPESSDINDKKLQVVPVETTGAVVFDELYLEGEQLNISHSSVNQGCEITGATSNSSLDYIFPTADAFTPTIQTIPLDKDWISPDGDYAEGRTCADFMGQASYLLDFACEEDDNGVCQPTESGASETQYTATCYPAPMPMIEVTCGLALQLNVIGLNTGETLSATASGSFLGTPIHVQTFTSNGQKTFNIAFDNGEDYTINNIVSSPTTDCLFDSTGASAVTFAINSTTVETLRCTPIP